MVLQNTLHNFSTKWLGLLILIILFAFLNYNEKTIFFSDKEQETIVLSSDFLEKEFPQLMDYSESDELDEWTVVTDDSGEISGYFILSQNNRWKYSGYAGQVPLFIKMNEEKVITEIQLLKNRETRRFLFKLYDKNFLKSWNGKTLSEAADSQVDTVSGVTLTSNAIIANLSEVLELSENKSPMNRSNYRQLIIRIAELILFLFALSSFFFKNMRKYRILYMVSLIVVFGFVAGDFISMAMIRGFLTGAVSFFGNPVLWIVFVSSIIVPLITNKAFYCNNLCPFGAAQELIGKLSPDKKKIPPNMKKVLNHSRPLLFGLMAVLIILDYKVDLSLVEPFAAFLYSVAAPITLILALGALFLSLYFSKPWCRWFCPTGQFLEYFRTDK